MDQKKNDREINFSQVVPCQHLKVIWLSAQMVNFTLCIVFVQTQYSDSRTWRPKTLQEAGTHRIHVRGARTVEVMKIAGPRLLCLEDVKIMQG